MRIATWNVNGLKARFEFVQHWLMSRKPDVVGLQELKMTDDKFPYLAFESEGYHCRALTQKAWNGVAILSKQPAEVLSEGLPGQEALGARLLAAQIGEMVFITVYCPNGKSTDHEDFPRKLAWFESLFQYLKERHSPKQQLVLCGDFNICPTQLDTWNEEGLSGKVFHTPEERQCFRNLTDWGLVDVFRHLHPDAQTFSWWDYRFGAFHRNMGLRIDFLMATEPLLSEFSEVQIDRDYRKKKDGLSASDHAPVFADFED